MLIANYISIIANKMILQPRIPAEITHVLPVDYVIPTIEHAFQLFLHRILQLRIFVNDHRVIMIKIK